MDYLPLPGAGRFRGYLTITLCLACWLVLAGDTTRAAAQDFTVTVQTFQNYTVNGAPDPTLTLVRGRTYQFAVSAPGHPFYIKTQPSAGIANPYNDGVTNNGATSGIISFSVPQSAPGLLYYQCGVHSVMLGELRIVDPSPVPGLTISAAMLLLALLLGGGLMTLRHGTGSRTRRASGSAIPPC